MSYLHIDSKSDRRTQHSFLRSNFPLHAEGCAEIVSQLIPHCKVLELYDSRGFSVQIERGNDINDTIAYILDYENDNAIDGLLYRSTFDLRELDQ